VRILLDTQCWLYWLLEPERLNAEGRRLFEEQRHPLHLSAASSWEIAIKTSLGKLRLPRPPDEYVPDRLRQQGVVPVPIQHSHALRVARLPAHHQDPFDRLIVAQAQIDRFSVLTTDSQLLPYEIDVIWASRQGMPARSRRRKGSGRTHR
jgi:PIN domain nuclease of toxin-antitoxin system